MASTGLPGKPLADICGLPMIVHVWKRAVESNVGQVLVAAAEIEDRRGDPRPWRRCHHHRSRPRLRHRPDRASPVLARSARASFRHVVNLQGDLPTIDPLAMQRCLGGLDQRAGRYFDHRRRDHRSSRCRQSEHRQGHRALGSDEREVAYARDFQRGLRTDRRAALTGITSASMPSAAKRSTALSALPVSALEAERKLEQMRALDNGMRIAVVRVDSVPFGCRYSRRPRGGAPHAQGAPLLTFEDMSMKAKIAYQGEPGANSHIACLRSLSRP